MRRIKRKYKKREREREREREGGMILSHLFCVTVFKILMRRIKRKYTRERGRGKI
jgi:hypothetical protein